MGAEVRSVQIAFKGEDSHFFRVHQCGAEPYVVGRGGVLVVEVDFRRNIKFYEDNREHHKDTRHPRTYKRAHISTVRSVHPPRPLTPESVHAAHLTTVTAIYQYTATTLMPVRRDNSVRTIGPLKSTLTVTLHSISLRGHTISSTLRNTTTNDPPRMLIRVSDIRGRALCLRCHGGNDDAFHF